MANNRLKKFLDFANLQMASEAFLNLDGDGGDVAVGNITKVNENLVARLVAGNGHPSRFQTVQAEKFVSEYQVLAQYRNDNKLPGGAGFSGTLFRNRSTQELTLSFRSTGIQRGQARLVFVHA